MSHLFHQNQRNAASKPGFFIACAKHKGGENQPDNRIRKTGNGPREGFCSEFKAWVKDAEAEKLFRIREAEETKNSLMQVASEHIAPLQDAADLEIATEEEISLLEAWKKYRVLLNRVDTSTAQDIEWPALP